LANRKILDKEERGMGQLGGFSLVIHLGIIILSALLTVFEKIAKIMIFYFSWGVSKVRSYKK